MDHGSITGQFLMCKKDLILITRWVTGVKTVETSNNIDFCKKDFKTGRIFLYSTEACRINPGKQQGARIHL